MVARNSFFRRRARRKIRHLQRLKAKQGSYLNAKIFIYRSGINWRYKIIMLSEFIETQIPIKIHLSERPYYEI